MDDGTRDFEAEYQGAPPWDIGVPQPEVVRLADEGAFRGHVLDVGCGTGENALFLAGRGVRVTGADTAPTALARAREKAAARGLQVPFVACDARDLRALKERFDTVLDCGLFHVFHDAATSRRYAESLADAVASGGQVQLLCFSDEEPPGPGPRRVSEWDLRSAFRGLFVLSRLRPGRFQTRMGHEPRASVATLTRL